MNLQKTEIQAIQRAPPKTFRGATSARFTTMHHATGKNGRI